MIHVECMLDVRLPAGLGPRSHRRATTASIHGNGTGTGAAFHALAQALFRSVVLA